MCLLGVHFEEPHIWAILRLCVEWILIAYLAGSHWPILLCLQLQNNTQAHLRVLWALDEFMPLAQESGYHPKTIFVRVALFQTFIVYYILQPPPFFLFFLKLGFQIQPSDSSKKPFYVVNHSENVQKAQ